MPMEAPVQLSLWRGTNGIWDDHFEMIAEYMAEAGITPLVGNRAAAHPLERVAGQGSHFSRGRSGGLT